MCPVIKNSCNEGCLVHTNQVGSSEIEVDPSARSQIVILREKSGDDLSVIGVVHKYLSVRLLETTRWRGTVDPYKI